MIRFACDMCGALIETSNRRSKIIIMIDVKPGPMGGLNAEQIEEVDVCGSCAVGFAMALKYSKLRVQRGETRKE